MIRRHERNTEGESFHVEHRCRADAGRSHTRSQGVYASVAPYGGATYFGQAYRWQQVLHYKQWTFIAIAAWIREIAGGAPLNLGRIKQRNGKGSKGRFKRVLKNLGGPKSHHEFEPYDDDDPMVRLFEQPNEFDVQYDLWAYVTLFYCLCGEVYLWVMRDVYGMPRELWVIPTHWLRLCTANDGNPSHYSLQSPWGALTDVQFDEVVVLRMHSPLNRFEGNAVSLAIAEWIDAYEASVRARLAQYKNGAIPSFHVALGDTFGDPDEAFLARFYSKWFQRFQGENRTNLPLITGPDVDVKALGISPVEMGYVANEDQYRDMTLAAYGVPKAVVGLEPTNDTSAYAPQRQFCRFTINPTLCYFGQVFTTKVIRKTPSYEDGVAYWDDRVVDDPERKQREIESRFTRGNITPNEERALWGAEPFPHGGDNPFVGGVEVPWVTGKPVSEQHEIDQVFHRAALNGAAGANGGYLNGRR